ncbi:MAG: hypothetical protein ABIZ91_15455 [Gemmatimonadaceae bacterium]
MQTLRERRTEGIGPGGKARRSARATAVSVVLHIVLVFGLWEAFQSAGGIQRLLEQAPEPRVQRERLRFVTVAPAATPVPTVASVGGGEEERAGRTTGPASNSLVPSASTVPIVSPTDIPAGIPAPGAGFDVNAGTPAGGPLAAGRGPLKGLQPGYADPRLWVRAPTLEYAPKTSEERLDSAVASTINRYRDSVLANTHTPNKFERGDWTYETKDGKRYGMDQQFIRLGKFSIPTALLALLPLNQMQGNPIENDRQKRLAAIRVDIMSGAQASMNEEDFRQAVKAIRERKEKERAAAEKQKKAAEKTISDR